jgi:hypothetical protein
MKKLFLRMLLLCALFALFARPGRAEEPYTFPSFVFVKPHTCTEQMLRQGARFGYNDVQLVTERGPMTQQIIAIHRLEEEYNVGQRPDSTRRERNHTVPRGAWMNWDKFRDKWVPQLRGVASSKGPEEFPSGVGNVQGFADNFPFDLIIQGSDEAREQ